MDMDAGMGDSSAFNKIWQPPEKWDIPGEWLWWFWLFFFRLPGDPEGARRRQLMVLWSIKKDDAITCNGLDIRVPVQLEKNGDGWALNGAVAAWYFDGKDMHEDFLLEQLPMCLSPSQMKLSAEGKTSSSFSFENNKFVVRIKKGSTAFEFASEKKDSHPSNGPNYSISALPLGMSVEGTRVEIMQLGGYLEEDGKKSSISGTSYFQKILLAAPPPQWYWGLFHFPDGSFFTYMQSFVGRATLAGNLLPQGRLKKPTASITRDIFLYHAPTGETFEAKNLTVTPKSLGGNLWEHRASGGTDAFRIETVATAYSHACWSFKKKIGGLPISSTFKYNEYPALIERLELAKKGGKKLVLHGGWGSMENSWGFII